MRERILVDYKNSYLSHHVYAVLFFVRFSKAAIHKNTIIPLHFGTIWLACCTNNAKKSLLSCLRTLNESCLVCLGSIFGNYYAALNSYAYDTALAHKIWWCTQTSSQKRMRSTFFGKQGSPNKVSLCRPKYRIFEKSYQGIATIMNTFPLFGKKHL